MGMTYIINVLSTVHNIMYIIITITLSKGQNIGRTKGMRHAIFGHKTSLS